MIAVWRQWALAAGLLIGIGGIAVFASGGGPVLMIVGVVVLVTAAIEPIYGRPGARPQEGKWRPTGEKFVDPETGKLVIVWFDPASGERRYVADEPNNRT